MGSSISSFVSTLRAAYVLAAAVIFFVGFSSSPVSAGDVFVNIGGASTRIDVDTMADRKFQAVVSQNMISAAARLR